MLKIEVMKHKKSQIYIYIINYTSFHETKVKLGVYKLRDASYSIIKGTL